MGSMLLNTDEFATLSEVMGPARDVRVLAQKGTALTLREAAPHAELHAIIKRIRAALIEHRAMATDYCSFTLLSSSYKECIGITVAALSLGNPLTTLCG
ncbi:hypothetical protein HMPREF2604_07035 [Corynebacterium sp. HMSC055A01]|nr:hypothetical protein HMPREF2604_07035 [Corynebacterium sp. HMSC055A01]